MKVFYKVGLSDFWHRDFSFYTLAASIYRIIQNGPIAQGQLRARFSLCTLALTL